MAFAYHLKDILTEMSASPMEIAKTSSRMTLICHLEAILDAANLVWKKTSESTYHLSCNGDVLLTIGKDKLLTLKYANKIENYWFSSFIDWLAIQISPFEKITSLRTLNFELHANDIKEFATKNDLEYNIVNVNIFYLAIKGLHTTLKLANEGFWTYTRLDESTEEVGEFDLWELLAKEMI